MERARVFLTNCERIMNRPIIRLHRFVPQHRRVFLGIRGTERPRGLRTSSSEHRHDARHSRHKTNHFGRYKRVQCETVRQFAVRGCVITVTAARIQGEPVRPKMPKIH